MKCSEFQFNPNGNSGIVFDSFCYLPENIYERKMGGIFMLGELKRALPHNYKLPEKISSLIRKEFYSKFQRSSEFALKESLKRVNDFLSAEVSKENTDWLGNLNFSIISLKNLDLHFTKIGGIKIFLIRGPNIIDIGQKLDTQEIEPYPLKVFSNIVSGKLADGDVIIAITEEIFPSIKWLIGQIAQIHPFDEKGVRTLIKAREADFATLYGSFFILYAQKTTVHESRKPKIIFQREIEKFSMLQIFSPSLKYARAIGSFPKKLLSVATPKKILAKFPLSFSRINKIKNKFSGKKERKAALPEVLTKQALIKVKVQVQESSRSKTAKTETLPENCKKKIKILAEKIFPFGLSVLKFPRPNLSKLFIKKYISILILAAVLLAGFFIFQAQERQKLREYRIIIQNAKEQVIQAESLMLLGKTNSDAQMQANAILSKSWSEILPLSKIESGAKGEALLLKAEIEKDLEELNKMVKIADPEEFFSFPPNDYIPQKMLILETNLYFFSPYAENLVKINANGQVSIIQTEMKFNKSTNLSADSALLFAKPAQITPFKGGQLEQSIALKNPYPEFNFTDFVSFDENLYFLDGEHGQIIRYLSPISETKDDPRKWLWADSQKPVGGKSITVDGSVWVLNSNNQILKYRSGRLQETITLSVFPQPKGFSKINSFPSLPYIFIVEPIQNRIVLMNQNGTIFKQFQSPKFDKLVDITVSPDGRTLWVLNGLKVYKISL